MTPTRPLRVAATARRTAGLDHLDDRDVVALARVAQARPRWRVLQAMTSIFTPSLDEVVHDVEGVARAPRRCGCGPYGPRAVSPT